ncbi:hypothetical protein [Paraburkholderia dipogonis]|uniref:hypothetical protein n=1 Tax=Paraburkholderia dipogonis TaxID=1211383 RepID=UPI0038B7ECFD
MWKNLVACLLLTFSTLAYADYCVDQYDGEITKVNAELGALVKRQADVDKRIAEIFVSIAKLSADLSTAAAKIPPDIAAIQSLGKQIADLNREKATLEAEGYKNQDRVAQLKGAIPADLQGRLRGCVEATAPTNNLVNLAIQTIAILSTGGAALALPPKALYVDMSAVLNGYPTGGDHSVINEARETALKALPFGMGNQGNDIGKTLRDPGRILRCPFGC